MAFRGLKIRRIREVRHVSHPVPSGQARRPSMACAGGSPRTATWTWSTCAWSGCPSPRWRSTTATLRPGIGPRAGHASDLNPGYPLEVGRPRIPGPVPSGPGRRYRGPDEPAESGGRTGLGGVPSLYGRSPGAASPDHSGLTNDGSHRRVGPRPGAAGTGKASPIFITEFHINNNTGHRSTKKPSDPESAIEQPRPPPRSG
jgi:hypothetical protein